MSDSDAFAQQLLVFEAAMDVYDIAVKERESALKLCDSIRFQGIYVKRGCPPYYQFYDFSKVQRKPMVVVSTNGILDRKHRPPTITELLADFEEAYMSANNRTKKKHENRFFEMVMVARCSAIERYCSLTYHAGVGELIRRVRREKDRKALITLVELDTSFLTAPFVAKIIREAEIGNDSAFKRQLAEALLIDQRMPDGRHYAIRPVEPKKSDHKRGQNDQRRNRFALSAALAAGLDGKTEEEFAEFFRKYDDSIGQAVQRTAIDGFYSYESKGAIHQALRTFDLNRQPAKAGRKKGRSTDSTGSPSK